eukprot:GHVQ01031136.1.p1 GENE.GHVQ01031136.1~~GHVQ01031136.1.p1  ORF type:complete len:651 (-),score=67.79 GHVQ01031136.1:3818-5770(-)
MKGRNVIDSTSEGWRRRLLWGEEFWCKLQQYDNCCTSHRQLQYMLRHKIQFLFFSSLLFLFVFVGTESCLISCASICEGEPPPTTPVGESEYLRRADESTVGGIGEKRPHLLGSLCQTEGITPSNSPTTAVSIYGEEGEWTGDVGKQNINCVLFNSTSTPLPTDVHEPLPSPHFPSTVLPFRHIHSFPHISYNSRAHLPDSVTDPLYPESTALPVVSSAREMEIVNRTSRSSMVDTERRAEGLTSAYSRAHVWRYSYGSKKGLDAAAVRTRQLRMAMSEILVTPLRGIRFTLSNAYWGLYGLPLSSVITMKNLFVMSFTIIALMVVIMYFNGKAERRGQKHKRNQDPQQIKFEETMNIQIAAKYMEALQVIQVDESGGDWEPKPSQHDLENLPKVSDSTNESEPQAQVSDRTHDIESHTLVVDVRQDSEEPNSVESESSIDKKASLENPSDNDKTVAASAPEVAAVVLKELHALNGAKPPTQLRAAWSCVVKCKWPKSTYLPVKSNIEQYWVDNLELDNDPEISPDTLFADEWIPLTSHFQRLTKMSTETDGDVWSSEGTLNKQSFYGLCVGMAETRRDKINNSLQAVFDCEENSLLLKFIGKPDLEALPADAPPGFIVFFCAAIRSMEAINVLSMLEIQGVKSAGALGN